MATIASGGNVLDFNVCQNAGCTSFDFNESTGVYSSVNTGGWDSTGATNFAIADVISAYIVVTLPDGTICTPFLIYSTFPDSTGLLSYTVNATDIGQSGLSDGIYTIEYQVNVNNVNNQTVLFTKTKTVLFTCNVKCCVDKLIAKIATADCDCESPALKNAILAFSLYQSLLLAGGCGNLTSVSTLLNRLQKMCSITNCGCN
jgi:hypothetical protein